MTTESPDPAAAAGRLTLGDGTTVNRMGFGAMRITGAGIWGDPPDRGAAIALLRRAVQLGVDLIDTADSYGPFVSEDLIREALHTGGSEPYGGVTIATKGGFVRPGPRIWDVVGRPAYLRFACEMSLRRLGVDTIDLYQLHRIDPQVPAEDQFGELRALQQEGKIRHVGLSQVGVAELRLAQRQVDVASVQNRYNLLDRGSEDVLRVCTQEQIAFLPWYPMATGRLARLDGPLDALSRATGFAPSQLALAWLLHRSPVMLPIPGTSSIDHLEQNVAAAALELDDDQLATLDASG